MNTSYGQFVDGFVFTGELPKDIERFLTYHHEHETYEHTVTVADEAVRIARLFDVDLELARTAALLHDVSNVIPKTMMMSTAENQSITIMEEEFRYPRILHQKLSKDMANKVFGCTNLAVLSAIECHTTLKAKASRLDKVLFAADKISWNLPGEHPFQEEMKARLERLDLDGAVLVYLNHVWEQSDKLKLVHPWLIEAREELLTNC